MDLHGGEAATSPSRAQGGISSRQKPLHFLLGCPRVPPFPIKGGPRQPKGGGQTGIWNKTSKKITLQVEQAHGFRLGLEAEKRGDLPKVGSAHLLPLAATLPGSWPRTQLVARHHDDIYPDM